VAKPRPPTTPSASAITATDRQIDALVYQLYALTPEEIALVEENDATANPTN